MGSETLVASAAAALGALLAALILNMLRNQNTRMREFVVDQEKRHDENRHLLHAINGRVRATEVSAAGQDSWRTGHMETDDVYHANIDKRMDGIRTDLNALRADLRADVDALRAELREVREARRAG